MRLSSARLAHLPPAVRRPSYRPDEHGVGIVHLGIGAFHRAHQAAVFDDVLTREGGDWRILGASLRSRSVHDQLAPQDGLYSLTVRNGAVEESRIIGAVAGVLVAPEQPPALVEALARPATRLVTLTITEKGYARNPATGRLDRAAPGIAGDLEGSVDPSSALGFLTGAFRLRRERGERPPVLLSCDNLPDNGRALRSVLLEFAAGIDPALAEWIDRHLATPSTMVDRIVPATTGSDLDRAEAILGVRDEGAVFTEPFTQWVVEDDLPGDMPDLAAAGVQLVADVRPFELAKLRMLNGSHSTLAYLGALAGHRFVHEAIADPALAAVVRRLMLGEAAATLPATDGLNPASYADALIRRFNNRALDHRLRQIAMDGSQKLPQRLAGTIADALRLGLPYEAATLGVAAWIAWVAQEGRALDDPLADRLAATADAAGRDPEALAGALLGVAEIFGEIGSAEPVRQAVTEHLRTILTRGARAAAAEMVAEPA